MLSLLVFAWRYAITPFLCLLLTSQLLLSAGGAGLTTAAAPWVYTMGMGLSILACGVLALMVVGDDDGALLVVAQPFTPFLWGVNGLAAGELFAAPWVGFATFVVGASISESALWASLYQSRKEAEDKLEDGG